MDSLTEVEEAEIMNSEEEPLIRHANQTVDEMESSRTAIVGTHSYVNQYIAVICAVFGAWAMGTILGYSSPAIVGLKDDAEFNMTDSEASWFSSSVSLGALAGGPIGGILINSIGRKGTMVFSLLPYIAAWLFIGLAHNFGLLLVGRVIGGICCGITSLTVPTYISEISSASIRGTLTSAFQLFVTIGILYSYSVGTGLDWRGLAWACFIIPVCHSTFMFFNKESPSYLAAKGKDEEAKTSLQHFRGKHYNVQSEYDTLMESIEESKKNKSLFKTLQAPYIFKPFLISLALMFYQQASGINAVLFNLETIFEDAGSSLSPDISSIIIGAVQVVSTFIAALLMDKAGRKILLVISSAVMAVSLAGLGAFFYEKENNPDVIENLNWLPLTALILYCVAFSIGYGPVPWIMMGELFSPNVREIAGSIATMTNWTMAFVITVTFEPLQGSINDSGVYWLFAGICVLSFVFCIMVVPETKGKSLEEVTLLFGGPVFTEKR